MKGRIQYLDGMRGLMAVNVVLHHFIIVFFPAMFFIQYNTNNILQKQYAMSPLSVFTNGNIAVQYFFVLSGFLITTSILKSSREYKAQFIFRKTYKKYKGLITIVFIGTFFSYLLMKGNFMFHLDSIGYGINSDFIIEYNNFDPSFKSMLYNVFIRTFTKNNQYVGPLWTMKWELWGSILCLITVTILKDKKYRRISYVILSLVVYIISTDLSSFIFGIFVADLYFYKKIDTTFLSRYYYRIIRNKVCLFVILMIGLYFATVPSEFVGIYSVLSKIPYMTTGVCHGVGISLIFWYILNNIYVQKILTLKTFLWLGKISPFIYALHWPLMLFFEHYIFQVLIKKGNTYNFSAILSFIISFPLIILISYLFHAVVDKGYCKKMVKSVKVYKKDTLEKNS